MSQPPQTPANKPGRADALKRALVELRDLRAKLAAAERATAEPIAIIGAGCRLPGAASPAELWELLARGQDATRDIPRDRWDADALYDPDPEAPGRMYTRRGGFIDHVDCFDERFFHISAREAASMDPQQRVLLEVSWEALEHAGLAPDRLARSRAGVFVGISSSDYAHLMSAHTPLDAIDPFLALTAYNFVPGRLSYLLGLQGPSMAVDTACSSSLVAVHLACHSLRTGESDVALAGGVNLILAPLTHVLLSKTRALAADGRCKTFDAAADGYGRSEGCGVVVLRRLSDAVAAGDRVLAVIRGSAVNQDGPSSGLTVPSGDAQQSVIRDALHAARVEPAEVGYVEAHGTGTPLGDPIEVRALAAVYGTGRDTDAPLLTGSIKTNIGHTEASAGVAGLIKTALSLYHGELPAHLHMVTPSPHIDWARVPVRVVREPTPWPDSRRIAGVSSFGASGTNAHLIVEAPPAPARAPGPEPAPGPALLCLSARTESALVTLAGRYQRHLETSPAALADVCYTAHTGRAHLPHRLAIIAPDRDAMQARLEAYARGERPPRTQLGHTAHSDPPQIAFLCTGQGAQYAGMARRLYDTAAVFRQALDQCDALLRPHMAQPLLSVLYPDADDTGAPADLLDQTEYTQPVLFALEWSLAALWRSWGIEPAAVLGHSVGEYVAACLAGVLSLEDSLRLIAARGRLMQALPRDGAMAALFTDEATVAEALRERGEPVTIAAVNGPTETVISGARAAVDAIVQDLGERGVRNRRLAVSHAFHSPLIEPMLAPFDSELAAVRLAQPRIPLISNLTGDLARDEITRPGYFSRHARQTVRFRDSIDTLRRRGIDIFLELGPRPVLCGMGRRCVPEGEGVWLPSLRPKRDDRDQLLDSLATLYTRGARIDWRGVHRDQPGRVIDLPTYPFERRRHWIDSAAPATSPQPGAPVTGEPGASSLLGRRLSSPALQGLAYESQLAAAALPMLRDHRVYGRAVVSGVVHLSLVAEAMTQGAGVRTGLAFEDVQFTHPLLLPETGARTVQTLLTLDPDHAGRFQLVSPDPGADGGWTVHTTGTVRPLAPADPRPAPRDIDAIRARCTGELAGADFYQRLWRPGEHELGPSFRVMDHIWRRDGEALARLALPAPDVVRPPECDLDLELLLDTAIGEVYGQALMPAVPDYQTFFLASDHTFIGRDIDRICDFARAGHRATYIHAVLRDPGDPAASTLCADAWLLTDTGEVLAVAEGLRVERVSRATIKHAVERTARRAARRAPALSRAELTAASPPQRHQRLREYLRQLTAEIIGVPASDLDHSAALSDLGIDSLLATELKSAVQADLDADLPLAELIAGRATLAALVDTLSRELPGPHAPPDPAAPDQDATEPPTQWLRPIAAAPAPDLAPAEPRLKLFCFPHGGAGASAYQPWRRRVGPDIDTYAVQLPGREDRLRDPPLAHMGVMIDALVAAIGPRLEPPYAFFGASMGALIAFELIHALRRRALPLPTHLFVAACPAPHLPSPLHDQGNELRAALAQGGERAAAVWRRLGTTPEALLDAPGGLDFALPALRADLELILTYRHREQPPLPLPISVYAGRDDSLVAADDLAAWFRYTRRTFTLHQLPGGHLFYRTHPDPTLTLVSRAVHTVT